MPAALTATRYPACKSETYRIHHACPCHVPGLHLLMPYCLTRAGNGHLMQHGYEHAVAGSYLTSDLCLPHAGHLHAIFMFGCVPISIAAGSLVVRDAVMVNIRVWCDRSVRLGNQDVESKQDVGLGIRVSAWRLGLLTRGLTGHAALQGQGARTRCRPRCALYSCCGQLWAAWWGLLQLPGPSWPFTSAGKLLKAHCSCVRQHMLSCQLLSLSMHWQDDV